MTMKFCNACKTEKILEEDFGKDVHSKDGHTNYCKICRNSRARAWERANNYYKKRNNRNKVYRTEYYSRPEVKERMRDQWFQKKYGISLRDYKALARKQGGKCAICKRTSEEEPKGKRLAVDHCHETNTIRGLLCQNCNRGMGLFGDNIALLEKAIAYLKRNLFREAL